MKRALLMMATFIGCVACHSSESVTGNCPDILRPEVTVHVRDQQGTPSAIGSSLALLDTKGSTLTDKPAYVDPLTIATSYDNTPRTVQVLVTKAGYKPGIFYNVALEREKVCGGIVPVTLELTLTPIS